MHRLRALRAGLRGHLRKRLLPGLGYNYRPADAALPRLESTPPRMSTPPTNPGASTILLAGSTLGHATAMSVTPAALRAQSCNTAMDQHWFDVNVPCRTACPADTDIPGYLEAVHHGDFDTAYRINLEDNVFPGVLGRVCSRPCESACRHGDAGNGQAVAICFSKRAAGDHQSDLGTGKPVPLPALFPQSGRRVAVIGAGVAGLACARQLARYGHTVTVFEKHRAPGGMLIQGIPMFRLPREVIRREIAQVEAQGVEISCGVAVGRDIELDDLAAEFDAVVLAAGTLKPHLPQFLGRPCTDAEHGLEFLLAVNEFERREIGARVLVIGGGYTALDCARTALRLGAKTTIAYRRDREAMVVLPGEIEAFLHEGGELMTRLVPLHSLETDGHIDGMRFMRAGKSRGRHDPIETIAGSELDIAASQVIFATGQSPDCRWVRGKSLALLDDSGALASTNQVTTAQPKIFVAGDFALGATTLISAIGHAKQCALAVDRFLSGKQRLQRSFHVSAAMISKAPDGSKGAAATGRASSLNTIPLTPMPLRMPAERALRGSLECEVETGYDANASRREASRCYLCNYKFEIIDALCVLCDECLRVKPVPDCIVEISALETDRAGRVTGYQLIGRDRTDSLYYNRLWIDQSRCIRCGACEAACPVNAITVQKISCESSCQ